MREFASGWKENYYGKADVVAYRLSPPAGFFGASVTMLIYGDAFLSTYTKGDNTGLIATDSMKNFIQWETAAFDGDDLEAYCRFLANRFLETYPQTEGVQIRAVEVPFAPSDGSGGGPAFVPGGPERATARVEMNRGAVLDSRSGLQGFRLLRLGGSAFHGFVRDRYTTLPETTDRPLHMWLDLEWVSSQAVTARVRRIVHEVFRSLKSGSIQQVIYEMGTRMLAEIPSMSSVDLEGQNRTWDRVSEGIYTDPRAPYGVLGLRLRRE